MVVVKTYRGILLLVYHAVHSKVILVRLIASALADVSIYLRWHYRPSP